MGWIYRCPRCGEMTEGTLLPRDWPADVVRRWRQLESRMACPSCDPVALPDIDDDL